MIRRKLLAVTMALFLGAGFAACGSDDSDAGPDRGDTGGAGQSTEEDPTLGDDEGGGTDDSSADEDSDGGDEGTTPNSVTDSGSGTGSGRGD